MPPDFGSQQETGAGPHDAATAAARHSALTPLAGARDKKRHLHMGLPEKAMTATGAGPDAPATPFPPLPTAPRAGANPAAVRRGRTWRGAAILAGALLAYIALPADAALADLRLCNKTEATVSVAIGYKAKDGWTTEGWWNIPGNKCNTLIPGPLTARYYYLYAVDARQGGEWGGKAFLCTRRKMFTILGTEDCVARGYDRTGFFEIDTQEQRGWTVQLTEPTQRGTAGK